MSDALERTWRSEGGRIVAALARRLGDLTLAEDAAQDAVALALTRWPVDGVPANPGAWLTTTAWRRALDLVRHRRRRPTTALDDADLVLAVNEAHAPDAGDDDEARARRLADLRRDDDLLALLCACCHPALAADARVALTLRHVAGLTAGEIAAAFLVSLATMEKRLVRARQKLRHAGIRFDIPDHATLTSRLADVQQVIYLVFNEGYLGSGDGEPVRATLCDEALWLARQLVSQLPHDAESRGLLALLLLHHSRAAARQSAAGELLPFAAQDRSRWNTAAIAEARNLLAHGTPAQLGPFQVEAAIALLHATAPDAAHVAWPTIAELYGVLHRFTGSSVVAVQWAYARGRAGAVADALAALDALADDDTTARYLPRLAAVADLRERLGDRAGARDAWRAASTLTVNAAQRRALEQQLRRLA